jgi:hypothetical protein
MRDNFEGFYTYSLYVIAVSRLKAWLFSLKNMDIRQKVSKVYFFIGFQKRTLNLALFHYHINAENVKG